MRRLLIVALACLACAAVGARTGAVRTTTTCDAASPYDNLPDDAALQDAQSHLALVLKAEGLVGAPR